MLMSKKGENIYKRKDNRWEARYVKSHTADGRILYGYRYGKTYREAKQKVALARNALINNEASHSSKKLLFSYYCDEWLKFNQVRVKESTYVKYLFIMEKHIKPLLGPYKIQYISPLVIDEFSHKLLTSGLAPKTVRDILTVLRSVFRYINRIYPGLIKPMDIIYPRETHRELRVLSIEEQNRFIEYLLHDMDECKFGVLLSLLTGLRIGELCALRWQDISLNNRTIRVCSTMQRIKNLDHNSDGRTKIIISEPKSEHSIRIIPLTDLAVKLCERCKGLPEAYVLTGKADRYIEPRTLQYRFQSYARDCELENLHFHVLRHTFATRCVEVGFEIKSLSEILGHSSPQITLERYVHSSLELKRSNMEKLSQFTVDFRDCI